MQKKEIGKYSSWRYRYLQGTAYYLHYRPLGIDTIPLSHTTIFLETAIDVDYLFTTITDQYGHYMFRDIDTNTRFMLHTDMVLDTADIFNIPYLASNYFVTAHAYPIQQNLFVGIDTFGSYSIGKHFVNISSVDDKGNFIGRTHVILYSDLATAQADSDLANTDLANFTTYVTGNALIGVKDISIGEKIYYRAKHVISGGTSLTAFDSFTINSKLQNASITLK